MKFISHRGAAGLAPENSAESILLADRYDPLYIEIDIHQTADNQWVVYHGDLKRTYIGKKLDRSLAELKEIAPHLLTVRELVKIPVKSNLLLDIKVKDVDHSLIKTLQNAAPQFSAAFTSPHVKPLAELRKAFPKSCTYISQPYHEGPYRPIELAKQYDFTGCNVNKWWVGPLTYQLAKRYRKEMLTYTIDRTSSMWLVHRFFPEITIVSNHPERCIKL